LQENNIPVIFTSYNASEAQDDQKVLEDWDCNIIVNSHKNPFRSLKPHIEVFADNDFYFNNNYILITR
jgi:hypothetical protein